MFINPSDTLDKKKITMAKLQHKVNALYHHLGKQGLYVNTNNDIFIGPYQTLTTGKGKKYTFHLLKDQGIAYASPMLFAALTAMLNHGTMLFTGAASVGKTTSAYLAGHFFNGQEYEDIRSATIHGHSRQTEERTIARYHTGRLLQGEEHVLWRKFAKSNVKVVNEFNRFGPDILNIFLDFVDTGYLNYGDEYLETKPGPLFATMNYNDSGTRDVQEPMLDRFDIAVPVTSPQPWDLENILKRSDEKLNGGFKDLLAIPPDIKLSDEERLQIRQEIASLPLHEDVEDFRTFAVATVRYSEVASDSVERMTKGNAWTMQDTSQLHFQNHPSLYTENEITLRTARNLDRYSKAIAWLTESTVATMEHLKVVFPYVTWHKLKPTTKSLGTSKFANDRIQFGKMLFDEIQKDWVALKTKEQLTTYLDVKVSLENPSFSHPDLLNLTTKAMEQICTLDHPLAPVLAKHLESLYNARMSNVRT